jgi:hypothetical protein
MCSARVSKRHANGEVHSKGGTDHHLRPAPPALLLRASRMIVIPDDKIVSGAAYMKIGPVPTPLVLPFGFFPNKKNGSAGMLIPAWGDGPGRWAISCRTVATTCPSTTGRMQLTGDIYSRG